MRVLGSPQEEKRRRKKRGKDANLPLFILILFVA
jgi:hypothetical protein